MVKSTFRLASWAVVAALAVPALAEAQAIPRNGGGSSGSSGGSSAGSSGGSSGGGSVGSVGSGRSVESGSSSGSSTPAPRPSADFPRGASGTSTKASPARPDPAARPPAPGGVVRSGKDNSDIADAAKPTFTRAGVVSAAGSAGTRDRGNQPVAGYAVPRTPGDDVVSFPLFGPWGLWYPWFGGGFGWNMGYVNYNPWSYGATCWGFGRYGFWYDPWMYSWSTYDYGYGSSAARTKAAPTTGNLRIKANVAEAKVYVDGALAGIVDEFDGLTDHLELDGGRHVIELRAEGYESVSKEINVATGRTQTLRLSLKKPKN